MSNDEHARFMRDGTLQIDINPDGVITFAPVDLKPVSDVRFAVSSALQRPEDFPNVCDAIVPGDSITIAVDANLPQITDVILGALDVLDGVQASAIDVLVGEDASLATLDRLRAAVGDRAGVHVHDPDNKDALGYLAAGESADPIYLARLLLEADFVLPITIARPPGSLDPRCEAGGIFPALADRISQQRARDAIWHKRNVKQVAANTSEMASEAAWLLGLQMVVEVLPTMDARVAEVSAGTPSGVRRRLMSPIESSWLRGSSHTASLIIACIDGDAQQQNWGNVARAVFTASELVEPGGTIAVVSGLPEPPGSAMRRLASNDPIEEVLKDLRKDTSRDALVAGVITRVGEQCRIVIASELANEQIEELGLGVVDNREALERLIEQHGSAIVLRGAQFCAAGKSEEAQQANS